jgi:beta-xylosidase
VQVVRARVSGQELLLGQDFPDPCWAPDVSRRADGTWLMYLSATAVSTGFMCVGAAVADRVTGPYRKAG